MTVPFDSLPEQARIWIFPSSREMEPAEADILLESTFAFLDEWTAHNRALTASAKVEDGVFLVVGVDEQSAGASGCSIDKLHRFVKEVGNRLSLNLMDRLNVVFPGNPVVFVHVSKIPELIASGSLGADALVYDTTIGDLGLFQKQFRGPLRNTWLSRYIKHG